MDKTTKETEQKTSEIMEI